MSPQPLALAGARSLIEELASEAGGGAEGPWRELAHALFLTEEFRFVR